MLHSEHVIPKNQHFSKRSLQKVRIEAIVAYFLAYVTLSKMGIITHSLGFVPYTPLELIQFILAVLLVGLVLLQQSEADLGSAFGGNESLSTPAHTRRGAEKLIFNLTILIAILFAVSSLVTLIIR
jgi:protein translocase SecG subunit